MLFDKNFVFIDLYVVTLIPMVILLNTYKTKQTPDRWAHVKKFMVYVTGIYFCHTFCI